MPQIGDVLDETFSIVSLLGEGAAGIAYEVSLARPWAGFEVGTRFCLKWYKGEVFKREPVATVVARRIREAVTGGRLHHANLVRIHDTSEFWSDGQPRFLLMDLVGGEQLDTYIRGHQPSVAEARNIMSQLAHGVKALHENAIIHRDIKSANIVIDRDGHCVVLDLGVIRPGDEESITASQAFLGTLKYASPEYLFAESCTESSDIYSLGAVFFELLTGSEMFPGVRNFALLVEAVRLGNFRLPDADDGKQKGT
ncbi:serine/threonine-protein kinase [Singulisphaera sp. Ch08]|uniref:Serine/threonine-protein kinase n=1 Tax=Singulisphaera sp. Ch08 TaxID=3120278 RepID=A0AAU7CK15_9BACT